MMRIAGSLVVALISVPVRLAEMSKKIDRLTAAVTTLIKEQTMASKDMTEAFKNLGVVLDNINTTEAGFKATIDASIASHKEIVDELATLRAQIANGADSTVTVASVDALLAKAQATADSLTADKDKLTASFLAGTTNSGGATGTTTSSGDAGASTGGDAASTGGATSAPSDGATGDGSAPAGGDTGGGATT